MIKKITYLLLLILTVGSLFYACQQDNFTIPDNARLIFSYDSIHADTTFLARSESAKIMFDTIFTTIGSTTQSFRVINPYNHSISISSIKLAGGDDSPYQLNIDGEMKNSAHDVTIYAHDSIYIFVQVTIDPNNSSLPLVVNDSILFTLNNQLQKVKLTAWGQDVVPIRGAEIYSTTWTADKPYLVYDSLIIKKFQVLTIEPGTRIYFHEGAFIKGVGAIVAKGTPDKPIIFKTDRLESMYDDVPSKWYGILLFPNSRQSIFENVEIRNAVIGLQVGILENPGSTKVKLNNVKIEHVSYAGIFSIAGTIEATNTLIADCGYYCIALPLGGSYNFTHCTISNYWGSYSNRQTPSVYMANILKVEYKDSTVYYQSDLINANWNNSIIWGNLDSEIDFTNNGTNAFNFCFDHCLVKLADSIDVSNTSQFNKLIKNIDPRFTNTRIYNYVPDSLSPARNVGARTYGEEVPYDLNQVSRLADDAPDLGAYEYIYIPPKK
ncbi:MAG TPA: hypothetical protein PKH79_02970 [Prolixibacteraceae bacterium]|nr:hypothetical protein [Prolixibacteraceae bacterium]